MHNVLRSNILKVFFFGKQVVQIDKGRAEKKALVTGICFEQLKTTPQRYMDVFETLGFPLNLTNPNFSPKAILNDKMKSVLGELSTKLIGIAPFAAHEGKMYPLDEMKLVIEALSKDYKVVLFDGGQKEIEILNGIEKA